MRQLLILSGKGGTGKTTIAGAFIKLSFAEAFADCDVDAPNLHLITEQDALPKKTDYYGLPKAEIDKALCTGCDLCRQNCRFNAISVYFDEEGTKKAGHCDAMCSGKVYKVDRFSCEGCGVCEYVCPVGAISMKPAVAGELMLYKNSERVFSTAQLKMGSGNSGLLVTEVKKQLKEAAGQNLIKFTIIDGSPGIGCPVIASLSGADMVLIVAEPSLSGISDMERIIKTANQFQTKIAVCVNKYDTNTNNTEKIEAFCKEQKLPFIGRIPFDSEAVKAINDARTIVDIDCTSGRAVKEVYKETVKLLFDKGEGKEPVENSINIREQRGQSKP